MVKIVVGETEFVSVGIALAERVAGLALLVLIMSLAGGSDRN
jgi:hypothetical protein